MKPTDNLASQYPPELIDRFMATMRAQSPARPTVQPPDPQTAVIATKTAPSRVELNKNVQRLSHAKLRRIAEFYEQGHTIAETRERFGSSVLTVEKAVTKTGGVLRGKAKTGEVSRGRKRELDAQRLAAIATFYEQGHSVAETRERFGASNRTVTRAVLENGGVMRGRERAEKLTDDEARAVYGRYLAGELLHVIAAETGIAYTTYRTRWKRLGLPFPVNARQLKSE